MKCSYCGKEIDGKPIKVGPSLRYCNETCNILNTFEKYEDTSLGNMCKRMYPDIWEKFKSGTA